MVMDGFAGLVNSDFLERAQWRGQKAASYQASTRNILQGGPIVQVSASLHVSPPIYRTSVLPLRSPLAYGPCTLLPFLGGRGASNPSTTFLALGHCLKVVQLA